MNVYQCCLTLIIGGEQLEFFFLKATSRGSPNSAYLKKKKEKQVNLCCNCIYIWQLTVQILKDNDITKPTIHQHFIFVQSIQRYPLLSYPLLVHLLASSNFT